MPNEKDNKTTMPPGVSVGVPGPKTNAGGPATSGNEGGTGGNAGTEGGQQTPPGPKVAEETVAVPKSLLERLVKTVEDQGEKISILTEAADRNKLSEVERRRNSGKLVKSVRISTLGGKNIVGWRRSKDEVYFDQEGRLVEKQMIEVVYEDKTKAEISIHQFSNDIISVKAEVIRESRDSEGNIFYVVQFEDGKELEISQSFIN